jgi:hypothetical protein
VWSQRAPELFYRTLDNRIMVATYKAKGDSILADQPRMWSAKRLPETGSFQAFDLAPDGKRFAVLMAPDAMDEQRTTSTQLTFLFNFFDELRRRVPVR